ncbi:hypothetical protein F4808DRAFT_345707 [Astrocystis sublimbata]|nr:hypothetical protein F4808DRAFT_345707 [Astrocystis sublimbata]
MTPATTLSLKALLAMPTALRPVLLACAFASSSASVSSRRSFATTATCAASSKRPSVAALVIPEFTTSAITELAPGDLLTTSSLISAPGKPVEDELTQLFTKNPADFIYAESDFYKLRKNTRVPEVCVLGRSNVGKSSFVNALANRPTNALAHVSTKAGKTRSINTYGFGPAPSVQWLQATSPAKKDEDIPAHTFYLVDMPGYGHASLQEWGRNISLYLTKRTFVKGAIVLIDAEVGPKDSDFHLLQVLNDAQLKTAIVMTKADKARKGLVGLRETCTKIWEGIRAIEARTTEGRWLWERDIYVTAVGAKDSAVARSTLTTARLAVARLAGLVRDKRLSAEKNTRWAGKTVSFDDLDLQYVPGPSSGSTTNTVVVKSAQPALDISPPPKAPKAAPVVPGSDSQFATLEQAAAPQRGSSPTTGYTTTRPKSRLQSRRPRMPQARTFHSNPVRSLDQGSGKPTSEELRVIIDDFIKTLKADSARDQVRRLQQQRERYPPKLFKTTLKKQQERQAKRLQQQYPEQTDRTRAVFDRRLELEENKRLRMDNREKHVRAAVEDDWPATEHVKQQNDFNQALDPDEFEAAFAESTGFEDTKQSRRRSKR